MFNIQGIETKKCSLFLLATVAPLINYYDSFYFCHLLTVFVNKVNIFYSTALMEIKWRLLTVLI